MVAGAGVFHSTLCLSISCPPLTSINLLYFISLQLGIADPQRHIGGPAALGNSSLHQPIGHAVATTAATVMAGALGAAQMGSSLTQTGLHNQFGSGIDPLSLYLSKMSRSQLYEIISDMKVCIKYRGYGYLA